MKKFFEWLEKNITDDLLIVISVESLPTDYVGKIKFNGARVVTSTSGQGAILQHDEHLYELRCNIEECSWTILPQKLKQSVTFATLLALPPGTGCD